ncbi:unnamed protein product [Rotaria sp. Silwood1]|nr:unnamed protein product [Rotaria sp. Silwood1]
MLSILFHLIYGSFLTTVILAQDIDQNKLVCSQSDGTIEAPKGYCSRKNGNCSCTKDCTESLSIANCVCTRTDLNFAQEQQLANCSVWSQQTWSDYVRNSRQNSTNVNLPPSASNTPDGKGLLFSTNDDGLPWPITDGRDLGNLLIHGPHCLKMIAIFNKQVLSGKSLDNIYDRLHSEHCRRLARRVLYYYQNEEKNYQVQPVSLCSDLHKSYFTSSQSSEHHRVADKHKHTAKHRHQSSENPSDEQAKDNGLDYNIRYRRQTVENPPLEQAKDEGLDYGLRYRRQLDENAPTGGSEDDKNKYKGKDERQLTNQMHNPGYEDDRISYGLSYGKSVSNNNNQSNITAKSHSIYDKIYTDAEKEGSRKPSQQRIFDTISGQNLGNLLVKEWLELPLTKSESYFLAGWESELVVRTAAFGIYCIQGKAKHPPITEIRDLLSMKAK